VVSGFSMVVMVWASLDRWSLVILFRRPSFFLRKLEFLGRVLGFFYV
jgi:hypothetical protein